MNDILKLINTNNKEKLKKYKLIKTEDIFMLEIGMSICVIDKHNFKFTNAGKLLDYDDFFIITEYRKKKKIISIDTNHILGKYDEKNTFNTQMKYLYTGMLDDSIIVNKIN